MWRVPTDHGAERQTRVDTLSIVRFGRGRLLRRRRPSELPSDVRSVGDSHRIPGSCAPQQAFVAVVLASLPVLSMYREVIDSPKLNYLDYWGLLVKVANLDGSLNPSGIFSFANEHPTFIPSLIYWINARWMGASNHALGFLALTLATLCLVLLVRALPQKVHGWQRVAVVAAVSAALFSIKGLHNFAFGMSGVAWWSANLAAVAAVFAASRGRTTAALGAASIGSLCYGTAFAIWPAIAAVALLRRDRWWRVVVPVFAAVTVTIGWFLARDSHSGPANAAAQSVTGWVRATLATLGGVWSSDSSLSAALVAVVLLAGVIATLAAGVRQKESALDRSSIGPTRLGRPALHGWIGLLLYTLGSASLIGFSRAELVSQPGLESRYASISGLFSAAVLVLFVALAPMRPVVVAVTCVVFALGAFSLGLGTWRDIRAIYPDQQLLAVALRVDATPAAERQFPFPSGARQRLLAVGGYPFSDDFTLGCGDREIGTTLDLAAVEKPSRTLNDAGMAFVGIDAPKVVNGGARLDGWGVIGGRTADCVLVSDSSGTVVGGGITQRPRPEILDVLGISDALRPGVEAVAPTGLGSLSLIGVFGGTLVELGEVRI